MYQRKVQLNRVDREMKTLIYIVFLVLLIIWSILLLSNLMIPLPVEYGYMTIVFYISTASLSISSFYIGIEKLRSWFNGTKSMNVDSPLDESYPWHATERINEKNSTAEKLLEELQVAYEEPQTPTSMDSTTTKSETFLPEDNLVDQSKPVSRKKSTSKSKSSRSKKKRKETVKVGSLPQNYVKSVQIE